MKILLYSDIPPCTNVTAGIVLNKMCDFLLEEGHSVYCYSVVDPSLSPAIPADKQARMVFETEAKPRENWGGPFGSFVCNNAVAHFRLPGISKRVASFAKSKKVDLIWVVEQGQTMIKTARAVSRIAGIPYVVQTWDPTEWWLRANHFDSYTYKSVMREFGRVLHDAECFIAASWAMEKEFGEQYHCKRAQAVVLGFPEGQIKSQVKNDPNQFVIAMSGQIYAEEEFSQLVQALNELNWKHNGKKIILRLYGTYFNLRYQKSANVEVRGWIDQKDLLPELATADLLYCPYWFSADYAVVSRTSFPSKLSTYLKVAKPVMFHGPDYASPNIFLKEFNAGYRCNTSDPKKIAELICKIIDDPQKDTVCDRQYYAFLNSLTDQCMKRDFFKALNLPIKHSKSTAATLSEIIYQANAKVVHVNNVDLLGNRFNGYDMMLTTNRLGGWMRQLVNEKISTDSNVDLFVEPAGRQRIDSIITQYESDHSIRALIQPYARKLPGHCFFAEADIVHYHLTHNNVLSWTDMPALTRQKPSVLTIHDPWLFTGHCIHPIECTRWQTGCGDCPHLDRDFSMKEDNTALMFSIRKAIIEQCDIDYVVASTWMFNMAKASPIMRNCRIHHIPFGIDLNLFRAANNPNELRKKHHIDEDAFVLMFRQDPGEFKGMKYIIEMLKLLNTVDKKITILTVGATGFLNEIKKDYQVIEYPWVTDNCEMVELYACCDVFLMPSIAEAFGMMAIEAMACSKPVLVFEGTALPDVTFAPECGIAVPAKDSLKMCKEIERLMDHPEERQMRGAMGRKLAEENYDYDLYVKRHMNLYKEILDRNNKNRNNERITS